MKMRRSWTILGLCTALTCLCLYAFLVEREQRALAAQLIRLHVVASSDTAEDQANKLRVRDAVLRSACALTRNCTTKQAASEALRAGLPVLQKAAEQALSACGSGDPAAVRLATERFPRRDYETFSLPAGRYETLRVTVGLGQGHNWWCVAFPALCLPASSDGAVEAAAQAGFDETQTELLTGDGFPVSLKFRLLDLISALFP